MCIMIFEKSVQCNECNELIILVICFPSVLRGILLELNFTLIKDILL